MEAGDGGVVERVVTVRVPPEQVGKTPYRDCRPRTLVLRVRHMEAAEVKFEHDRFTSPSGCGAASSQARAFDRLNASSGLILVPGRPSGAGGPMQEQDYRFSVVEQ